MEKLVLAGLVVMTSVIGAVHADDKSDVQALFDAMVAANNANDMDKEQALYLPKATGFAENGGPLEAEFNWDRAREIIKNGGKWGFKYGKTDIAVHGSTAVVTGYRKAIGRRLMVSRGKAWEDLPTSFRNKRVIGSAYIDTTRTEFSFLPSKTSNILDH